MRPLLLLACCCAALSCREIQPVAPQPVVISGYLLQGTVTSANGVPIDSVQVRLWYNFDLADVGPIDTARPVLTDPTKIVDVSVLTPGGEFVRQLFLSYLSPGPVPRQQWDFHDGAGNEVPSGEYVVRTAFDTVVVKNERRIAQGLLTALTDAAGRFEIGMNRLPIGKSYDMYSVNNLYLGTYTVIPSIDLEFHKANVSGAASLALNLNQSTIAAFTVQ